MSSNARPPHRLALWMAVLLAAVLPPPAPLAAAPAPLAEVEIAAVRLASLYLDQGPQAWWEELAPGAPLAALGREAALREIEARAGEASGARWTLQLAEASAGDAARAVFTVGFPSGLEEVLVLSFEAAEGGFLLYRLGSSVEIAGASAAVTPPPEAAASREVKAAPRPAGGRGGWWIPVAAAVALLAVAGIVRRRPLRALAAAAAAVCLGWGLWQKLAAPAGSAAVSAPQRVEEGPAESGAPRLGELVELRRALTRPEPEAAAAALAQLEKGSAEQRAAALWQGQYLLAQQDLDAVEALLASYPPSDRVLQAELLRARLGFLRFQEVEAAAAYERALEVGVGYDDLLFEAAQVFDFLGFEERTDAFFRRLEEMGSRNPELYYQLAGRSVLAGWNAQASAYFAEGWRLQPLERDEVLSRPLLAALVQDFSIRALLRMDEVAEPRAVCAPRAAPALEFPVSASTRVVGSLFVAEFLDAELWVPNGCALASRATATFDPRVWRQRNETLALAELPTLMDDAGSKGVVVLPRLRDRVVEAAEALARRRRWEELVELTAGIADELHKVPANLARLRARALRETGRLEEARALLVRLAAINMKKQRPDPGTLLQLADLMVESGEYDVAVRLIEKADAAIPANVGYDRIQQIYMEKQLASAYSVHDTEHFEIRYPARRNAYLAERIGEILEAERARLSKWIPVGGGRTQVHLLPWGDFRNAWSSSVEILGLFDGKIRLPFADVQSFHPIVVSVLTHELAHAMIDDHTRSNAPHWLHEGLAQHVQMVQGRINPIEGYAAKKNLLAFPLIESVLRSFASPAMIGVAYDEALWTVHYLEAVHGRGAIRRLLAAFRDGRTTEEAIETTLGMSLAAFDQDLWDWCLHRAPAAWKGEVVRYDRG